MLGHGAVGQFALGQFLTAQNVSARLSATLRVRAGFTPLARLAARMGMQARARGAYALVLTMLGRVTFNAKSALNFPLVNTLLLGRAAMMTRALVPVQSFYFLKIRLASLMRSRSRMPDAPLAMSAQAAMMLRFLRPNMIFAFPLDGGTISASLRAVNEFTLTLRNRARAAMQTSGGMAPTGTLPLTMLGTMLARGRVFFFAGGFVLNAAMLMVSHASAAITPVARLVGRSRSNLAGSLVGVSLLDFTAQLTARMTARAKSTLYQLLDGLLHMQGGERGISTFTAILTVPLVAVLTTSFRVSAKAATLSARLFGRITTKLSGSANSTLPFALIGRLMIMVFGGLGLAALIPAVPKREKLVPRTQDSSDLQSGIETI